jgi:hypothetical protein
MASLRLTALDSKLEVCTKVVVKRMLGQNLQMTDYQAQVGKASAMHNGEI